MERTIIKLCYRKIIDSSAQKPWDKFVLEDSYTEFLLQSQIYNQEKKYSSFSELINNVPNADKLHFLVSTAITGYLKQLNGIVPDVVNSTGKLFLPFKNFRFEIINSDTKNKALHKVAVNFYSEPLVWHATIGSQLLVSIDSKPADNSGEILTETFSLQPFVSIYSISQIK
jgi:hypothetical protein